MELVRPSPTRVLTVFWIEDADTARVRDPDFAIALQRDAAWRLHRDTLVEDRTRVEPVRFGPYAALRLQGVWQNAGEVAGGPLVAYIVHDAGRRRLYGVQCQLYAPGMPKGGWMRELEALASTFRIEGGG